MYSFFYFKPSNTQIVRGQNLANGLRAEGVDVREVYFYSPLLARQRLFAKKKKLKYYKFILEVLQSVISRILIKVKLKKNIKMSKIIHIPKRINFEALSILKENKPLETKVLYDFDDAIWTDAFEERHYLNELFDCADIIFCDNYFLSDEVFKRYGVKTDILPPYYNQKGYYKNTAPKNSTSESTVIGWLGSESTFKFIIHIKEPLINYLEARPASKLKIAGVSKKIVFSVFEKCKAQIECMPTYNASEMFDFLNGIDIGLFPTLNDDDSNGRGFLKVILYTSVGLPVIASSNDTIDRVIVNGENGLIADSNEAWLACLNDLSDPILNKKIGDKSYEMTTKQYSLESNIELLLDQFTLNK